MDFTDLLIFEITLLPVKWITLWLGCINYYDCTLLILLVGYLCSKEESGGGHGVAVELCERMEGIEAVHVHNGRVDT